MRDSWQWNQAIWILQSRKTSDLTRPVRAAQISCVFAQQGRKRPEDYRAAGAPPREAYHDRCGVTLHCFLGRIDPVAYCGAEALLPRRQQ